MIAIVIREWLTRYRLVTLAARSVIRLVCVVGRPIRAISRIAGLGVGIAIGITRLRCEGAANDGTGRECAEREPEAVVPAIARTVIPISAVAVVVSAVITAAWR